MTFPEVMAFYDYKISNVAKALAVTRRTVSKWKESDRIPFDKQCQLEVITGRKLIANKDKGIE